MFRSLILSSPLHLLNPVDMSEVSSTRTFLVVAGTRADVSPPWPFLISQPTNSKSCVSVLVSLDTPEAHERSLDLVSCRK